MKTLDRKASEILRGLLALQKSKIDNTDGAYTYPFVDTEEEIFEWWLVSPYLARELKEQGEVIIDALGCHWWGRTTSGQAIYMDGVIQKIAGE